jgi:hypothetical protein
MKKLKLRKKSIPTLCSFIHKKTISVDQHHITCMVDLGNANKRLSRTECICTKSARNSLSFSFHSPTYETVISSGCRLSLLLEQST